jgi:hypothetical protein
MTLKFAIAVFICIVSIFSLFLSFYTNYWHIVKQPDGVLGTHIYSQTDAFVLARILKSRQDGFFSDGGLIGYTANWSADSHDSEIISSKEVYLNGLSFDTYEPYYSQIGGQAMLFSFLDKIIHLSPEIKLRLFYALESLLLAIILTAIILWFYWEFSLTAALFVLISMLSSQSLTKLGGQLGWSMWAFYLPMVTLLYYLKRKSESGNIRPIMIGILVFITVFIKCLFNGYEYITTTLIMMMVPIIYYGILEKVNVRRFFSYSLSAVFGSCLAIVLSFSILCIQISVVKGSFMSGIEHIVYSLEKRTSGDSHSVSSNDVLDLDNPKNVGFTYVKRLFREHFIDASQYLPFSNPFAYRFSFSFLFVIYIFLIMSVYLLWDRKSHVSSKERQSYLALIFATWFSILAPLSWFIIFKQHTIIHLPLNNITWWMPFIFFGFAVCGLVCKNVLVALSRWKFM